MKVKYSDKENTSEEEAHLLSVFYIVPICVASQNFILYLVYLCITISGLKE